VHVVTVPPVGADPGDLWRRFATLLGLDPDAYDTRSSRSNSSLGLEQAELLRRVNAELGDRLPLPGPYTRVIKNVLAHRVLAERTGTPLRLDRDDSAFARQRSADIAERLTARGFDVVGDLAELVPEVPYEDGGAGSGSYPVPAADVVATEAVAALAATCTMLSQRITHHQHAQERLAALQRTPFRVALVEASRRRPFLAKARTVYKRAEAVVARRSRTGS
jgi:hypothetical protein